MVAALILSGLAMAVLRDPGKAGIAAAFVMVGVLVQPFLPQLAVAALLALAVVVLGPRLLRTAFPWPLVPRAAQALGLILMLTIAIGALQNGTAAQIPRDVGWAIAGATGGGGGGPSDAPDIYLLMLEDYPRADVLERVFGHDNGPFLAALEARGFVVSARARSNYSNSPLTLATMFQARHIEEIPEIDALRRGEGGARHIVIRDLINSGPVVPLLQRHGYTTFSADSGYEQLTLRAVDTFYSPGRMSDVERSMLQASVFATAADAAGVPVVGPQLRAHVEAEFAWLAALARRASATPRFAFVHVPLPHPPIVYRADGAPLDPKLLASQTSQIRQPGFAQLYAGQVEHLNALVLRTIDELAGASRPSVVVIMSDEGMGYGLMTVLSGDPVDAVAFTFAARTPNGEDLFGPAVTAINVFPALLERYLGEDLGRRSDRNYISGDAAPFDGYELPNTDAAP